MLHKEYKQRVLFSISLSPTTCKKRVFRYSVPDEKGTGKEHTEGHFNKLDASSRERRTGAGNEAQDGSSFVVFEVHLSLCL